MKNFLEKKNNFKKIFAKEKNKKNRVEKIKNLKKILILTLPIVVVMSLSQIIFSLLIVIFLEVTNSKLSSSTKMFWMELLSTIFTVFFVVKLFPKIVKFFTKCKSCKKEQNGKAKSANTEFKKDSLDDLGEEKFLLTQREEAGLAGLFTWTDILIAPVALIASNILAGVLLAVLTFLPGFNPMQTQNIGITAVVGKIDTILSFVSIVIIPAFFEEFIFRGWIYGKLRGFLAFWPAALITSALFGIAHGQLNVAAVTFVIGMTGCLLREFTGTIYAGILVHMLKNGIAYYILFFSTQTFWR